MKFILGKKMNMTQIWLKDKVMAVTPVLAGPCPVTRVKNQAKDGYNALQLAFGEKKEKNLKKPQLGQVKGLNVKPRYQREFRLEDSSPFKPGDLVSVETFAVGDTVDVSGISKGKGFQGVVKRHHFAGGRKTHGNKDQERMPGSIGPKGPAHVFKGTRMPGRMGNERVTTKNLTIAKIDSEQNILFLHGAVPGATNSLLLIKAPGDLKVNLKKVMADEEVKADEEAKAVEPAEARAGTKAEASAETASPEK